MKAIARAAFMIASQGAAVSGIFAATIVVCAFAAASLLHDLECAKQAWKQIRSGWLHERLVPRINTYAVRMYGPVDMKAISGVCADGKCAAALRIPELASDFNVDAVKYIVANNVGGLITSMPDNASVTIESWSSDTALAPLDKLHYLDPAPAILHAPSSFVLGMPPHPR